MAGVKGMRWGVRRAETRGSTPPSKRKPISKETEAAKPKKVSVKDMSDDDLRKNINRLQAEKQYKQLMTPEKSHSVVNEILRTTGKQVATNVITQVGTAYLSKAVGVNLNKALPEAYQVIGGKKK